MRQHIEEVLASGNADHATYIINWIAWAVQNPADRAEVALVFRGKKGTGKGTLGNTLVIICSVGTAPTSRKRSTSPGSSTITCATPASCSPTKPIGRATSRPRERSSA